MPRLFVAVRPPEPVAERISRLCQGLPGARWTYTSNLHLTLRFIGEVEQSVFGDIGEALMAVSMPPFEISLSGLGHFPKSGELRQLWVGVKPSDELRALKRAVDRIVDDAGAERESRKFIPHITIARFKSPPPQDRLARYLRRRAAFSAKPFIVQGFELFSSHLAAKGAEHYCEAAYDFVLGSMAQS